MQRSIFDISLSNLKIYQRVCASSVSVLLGKTRTHFTLYNSLKCVSLENNKKKVSSVFFSTWALSRINCTVGISAKPRVASNFRSVPM